MSSDIPAAATRSSSSRVASADVLGQLGADVRVRIYAGRAHEVSADEIVEAREWIAETA